MNPPALSAEGVTKTFPGVRALTDVSVEIAPGRVHALVGENGAGKSTLIKVLTGVYQPDAGRVLLGGRPQTFGSPAQAQQAGVATIYQEVNLAPRLSVAENLYLGREPMTPWRLIDRRAMRRRGRELMQRLGLDIDVTRPLGEYAVGLQQMVALARAVDQQARVVIMDEPTSALEAREVETLFLIVRRLRDEGLAIVYVSHRMDELFEICDDVTVLRDGRHVHSGPLADLGRTKLVGLMLGRDPETLRREGTTEFTGDHARGGEAVLRAQGLTVPHRLEDVGLEVGPGEVLGLGGLLGAGRSETLRSIAGVMPGSTGSVEIGGTAVRSGSVSAALTAGICMLPEDRKADGIIPGLSVRENIVLAALPRISRAGVVSRARQDKLVETFMRRLNIRASGPDQAVGELSGGNQQKVLLARLLCLEPKVLLLDEPTRGIDIGARAEIQGLIDELTEQGLAVVLVSSDMDELVAGADRLLVLRDGRLVGELEGDHVTQPELMAAIAEGEA